MGKYCPKCHSVYADDKNCCPKDGQRLVERSVEEQFRTDLSVVKNKIVWSMPTGVVAYRIDEAEMESLLHVDGIIVNESTIAYVYINGQLATTISGGVYRFISLDDPEYQKRLNQRFGGVKQYITGIWSVLTRLWVGTSLQDKIDDHQHIECYNSLDELENAIRENLLCSVILVAKNEFPLILKTDINNRYYNGQIGINLSVQVTNLQQFISKLLNGQKYLSTTALCRLIQPVLNDTLRGEDFHTGTIAPESIMRILANLQARTEILQCGVSILRVNDFAIQSDDLERLRNLDREINQSEEEIVRLQHIRTIKDRLVEEENRRKIAEARTQLDVAKIMQEINHDRIISNEEEQAFIEAITLSRQLRQFDNEQKLLEAAHRIEKAGILRRNEIAVMLADADKQKYVRDNELAMMQLSDLIERRRIEQQVGHEFEMNQTRHNVEVNRIADAYNDERLYKALEFDEKRFMQSMEQEKKRTELEQMKKENDLNILDRKIDIINKLAESEHKRNVELLNATSEAQRKQTETEGKIAIEIKQTEAQMTSDQLLASRVADLDSEAQVAVAQSIGSSKEALAKAEAEAAAAKENANTINALQEKRIADMKEMTDKILSSSQAAMNVVERVSLGAQERERARAEEYRGAKDQVEKRIDRQQEAMIDHVLAPAASIPTSRPAQPVKEENKLVKCPDCGTVNDVTIGPYCSQCSRKLV